MRVLALILLLTASVTFADEPAKPTAKEPKPRKELPPVDPSPENIARLIKTLDGAGMASQVRAKGAYQELQRIGRPAVPQLIEAMRHKSPWVRLWSAAAVASTRDPRGAGPMIKLLRDPFPAARTIATWHIHVYARQDPRIPVAVARQLEDPSPDVQKWAEKTLRQIKFRGAKEELRKLLHSDLPMARTLAFKLLLTADHVSDPAKAVRKAMKDPDWRVRSAAVRFLGEGILQDRKVVFDLLLPALDDPSEAVKADAVQVIGHILKETKCPKTKGPVVKALDKKLPPLLDARLPRLRGAALYLLAAGEGAKLFPRALAAAKSKDPELRLYGLKTLARCGVKNWDVIDVAEASLADEDPEVRTTAMAVLRWVSGGRLKVKFDPSGKPGVRAKQLKTIKALFDKARRRAGRLPEAD